MHFIANHLPFLFRTDNEISAEYIIIYTFILSIGSFRICYNISGCIKLCCRMKTVCSPAVSLHYTPIACVPALYLVILCKSNKLNCVFVLSVYLFLFSLSSGHFSQTYGRMTVGIRPYGVGLNLCVGAIHESPANIA